MSNASKASALVLVLAAMLTAPAVAAPGSPPTPSPYPGYSIKVRFGNASVNGVTRISPISRSTEVVDFRSGSDPSQVKLSPGRTSFAAVTLERGLSGDPSFELWANLVTEVKNRGVISPGQPIRKDVLITLLNQAGQPVTAYKLYDCWPSTYEAVSEIDVNSAAGQYERLTLQCDAWERDQSVIWPPS